MSRKIKWPNNKKFAFTIVDDTDGAFFDNISPVYDFLSQCGLLTTKTCWVFPPRDDIFKGACLEDNAYLAYLQKLNKQGFEMAFHGAGSGGYNRNETLNALEFFKSSFGYYPKMHINHGNNIDNIYWGKKRFVGIVKLIYSLREKGRHSEGDNIGSDYYWADFACKNIKYIRNRTFKHLNTLCDDSRLVYKEIGKQNSNYWFSSSDGMDLNSFLRLVSKSNIDKLEKHGGCAIIYTHFGYGFVKDGILDKKFKDAINYLSSKNGWFAPASDILDYVLEQKTYKPSYFYQFIHDLKWLLQRIFRK